MSPRVRTQADVRQMEKWCREQGFSDGYSGRPARSPVLVYQRAWKLGRQARERDGGAA